MHMWVFKIFDNKIAHQSHSFLIKYVLITPDFTPSGISSYQKNNENDYLETGGQMNDSLVKDRHIDTDRRIKVNDLISTNKKGCSTMRQLK